MNNTHTRKSLEDLSRNKLKKVAKSFDLKPQFFDTDSVLIDAILKEQDKQEGSNSGSGSSSEGSNSDLPTIEKTPAKKGGKVVYGLKPKATGVVVVGEGFIPRDEALKDQEMLEALKRKGNRAVIIVE